MKKWGRRIRAAIAMGVTWAVPWSLVGQLPRWILGYRPDAPFPIIFGMLGFMAGVMFSVVLMLAEGRRKFNEMSLPRFAGWGAMGGLLLTAVFAKIASLDFGDMAAVALTFAAACSLSAAGSLALARRAERQELSGGTEDVGLTEDEKRELLGR